MTASTNEIREYRQPVDQPLRHKRAVESKLPTLTFWPAMSGRQRRGIARGEGGDRRRLGWTIRNAKVIGKRT